MAYRQSPNDEKQARRRSWLSTAMLSWAPEMEQGLALSLSVVAWGLRGSLRKGISLGAAVDGNDAVGAAYGLGLESGTFGPGNGNAKAVDIGSSIAPVVVKRATKHHSEIPTAKMIRSNFRCRHPMAQRRDLLIASDKDPVGC